MTVGSTSGLTCQRKKAISSDCLPAVYFSLPHQTESGSYRGCVIYTTQQCASHGSFLWRKMTSSTCDKFPPLKPQNHLMIYRRRQRGMSGFARQTNKEEKFYWKLYVDSGNELCSSFWERRTPHWYWGNRVIVFCFCCALWEVEWWRGRTMVFGERAGMECQLCCLLG